jgi:hypothetical protein
MAAYFRPRQLGLSDSPNFGEAVGQTSDHNPPHA